MKISIEEWEMKLLESINTNRIEKRPSRRTLSFFEESIINSHLETTEITNAPGVHRAFIECKF
jgi:hypothetical protein